MTATDRARAHWEERAPGIVATFAEFVSIPNVAADPAGLTATAHWIVERFAERGITLRTHSDEGAPPVVYGRISRSSVTSTASSTGRPGLAIHPVDITHSG